MTIKPLHPNRVVLFIFVTLTASFIGSVFISNTAANAAVSAGNWQAGQIIDDSIFYNSGDMSVVDIQNFLNQKNPNCDTWGTGTSEYGGGTRAQYGASRGYPAPYVCLKDYYENQTTRDNNLQGRAVPAGALSAAQIIKKAADTYNISARALLVLIQKESPGPLITDSWPFYNQYRNAMGFGCPDTAPCDPQYEGFANQVSNAARQFQIYKNNPANYRHRSQQDNAVRYSPNASCGSSTVYIKTTATAGLYNYTPYQPNQAALNNMYGTGDGCSAYGNRNFWRLFSDWFGPTTGPGYSFVGATNPATTLLPNQIVSVSVTLKNQSGVTWWNDGNTPNGQRPTRLMMSEYKDTPYADTSNPAWLGTRNQVKMDQASVANGSNATFTFTFRGPMAKISSYITSFSPVTDGVFAYPDIGMGWLNNTPLPDLSYDIAGNITPPATMQPGQIVSTTLTVNNTGNTYWYNDSSGKGNVTRLGTIYPNYRSSSFYDPLNSSWVAASQISLQQSIVAPGGTGTFVFNWKAPLEKRDYTESFSLVLDGYSYAPGIYTIKTTVANYDYTVDSIVKPSSILPGDAQKIIVKLKNTGSATWYSDDNSGQDRPIRLALDGYQKSIYASTKDAAWLGNGNQLVLKEQSVASGAIATFEGTLAAPYQSVDTNLSFRPVRDGVEWLKESSELKNIRITTPVPTYNYEMAAGTINPPSNIIAGQQTSATLVIKNTGNTVWRNEDNTALSFGATRIVMVQPVYRDTSFSNQDSSWIGTKNQIKMITPIVRPGENATFTFTWTGPSVKGRYLEYFNVVIDGYAILPFRGMGYLINVI